MVGLETCNTSFMRDPYSIHRIAGYAVVDPAIRQWCEVHSLVLCTDFKDYDVRSVDVVGPGGRKCQVWIDPPEDGLVTVHIWPYAPPHKCLTVRVEDISKALEQAYDLAAQFVKAKPKDSG
jgi:hypothetical protein